MSGVLNPGTCRVKAPGRSLLSRPLLDWQKEYNTQVNRFRYVIEQAIANFKTWRIMQTDYRRTLLF